MPCPPRHPVRRRPRHPHSPIPPCRGFCPSAAGKADIGREPARAVPAASPCARPPASPVRPTPARRMPCPPASRALRRPRSPCGLSLRPPASPVRPNPAHRGFCPPRPLRARPHPLRSLIPACRQFFPALRRPRPPRGLTLRAAGFVRRVTLRAAVRVLRAAYPCAPRVLPASSFACAPREGRILAASQRVPCPPPAASPCARVRIHCAVLSLPAAGFFLRSAARVSCAD